MNLSHSSIDPARNVVQTLSEPFQADSEVEINSTPAATGQEIRKMMQRHNISVMAAANVLCRSPRYIRGKQKNGAFKGRESWDFLRFLPQRYKTMSELNSSDSWTDPSERQEAKLIMVKHWHSSIPCVAIKFNPVNVPGISVLTSCKVHNDSTDIYFGTVDNTGELIDGLPLLPVLSNRPEDHIRSSGSFSMQLAHEHCIKNWASLQCGDEIDVAPMAAAQAHRRLSRNDILKRDSSRVAIEIQ